MMFNDPKVELLFALLRDECEFVSESEMYIGRWHQTYSHGDVMFTVVAVGDDRLIDDDPDLITILEDSDECNSIVQ